MNHLTTETIEKYVKGEFPYGELLEISSHLVLCPQDCLARLNQIDPEFIKQADRLENDRIREIKFGKHFSDNDIEAYVTRKFDLGKRRSMSSHFTKCSVCATKLKDSDPDYLTNFIKDKLNSNDSAELVIKSKESKYNFRILVPAATFSIMLIVFLITLLMLPNKQNIDRVKMEELSSPDPANNGQTNKDANKNPANIDNKNQGAAETSSNSNNDPKKQNSASSGSKPSTKPVDVSIIQKQPKKNENKSPTIIVKDRSLNKNCESNPQLSITPKDEIITETQPNLTWKPLANVASYKIYVSDNQNNLIEESTISGAGGTSYKLTKKLELNKKYEWKVVVTLRDGKEVYSESALFSVGEKSKKLSPAKGKNKINDVRCLKSEN